MDSAFDFVLPAGKYTPLPSRAASIPHITGPAATLHGCGEMLSLPTTGWQYPAATNPESSRAMRDARTDSTESRWSPAGRRKTGPLCGTHCRTHCASGDWRACPGQEGRRPDQFRYLKPRQLTWQGIRGLSHGVPRAARLNINTGNNLVRSFRLFPRGWPPPARGTRPLTPCLVKSILRYRKFRFQDQGPFANTCRSFAQFPR